MTGARRVTGAASPTSGETAFRRPADRRRRVLRRFVIVISIAGNRHRLRYVFVMNAKTSSRFLSPPESRNAEGLERKVGFEFEFTGPSIEKCAATVRSVFGGVSESQSTFVYRVAGTEFGTFSIEIDSSIVKDKTYEEPLRSMGIDLDSFDKPAIEESIAHIFSFLVPYEISTPPIPLSRLGMLDDLREELRKLGARGTKSSLRYAFGLHINAEVPAVDHQLYQNVLRAFVLLYPWLEQRVDVDFMRRMAPYIKPFPEHYVRLILSEHYPTTQVQFIEDYLTYNPTRNRPLDLVPLLAGLDFERVEGAVREPHLIKPRTAFHYRMPNCLIDDPDWAIADEWNSWVAVERLAAAPTTLQEAGKDYLSSEESKTALADRWQGLLEDRLL